MIDWQLQVNEVHYALKYFLDLTEREILHIVL